MFLSSQNLLHFRGKSAPNAESMNKPARLGAKKADTLSNILRRNINPLLPGRSVLALLNGSIQREERIHRTGRNHIEMVQVL
jgi:hypothetical protein